MTERKTLAALVSMLVLTGGAVTSTATARVIDPYVYSGKTIDGTGSTAGTFQQLEYVAFDTANQNLYTMEQGHGHSISRFDAVGNPAPFSALSGKSSIETSPSSGGFAEFAGIAVDNSVGSSGDFFQTLQNGPLSGWTHDGLVKTGYPFPIETPGNPTTGGACGVAVDPEGDAWAADMNASKLIEVDHQGNATGVEVSSGFEGTCKFTIDHEGNFYVADYAGAKVRKLDPAGNFLYDLNLAGNGIDQFAVDPSTNHLFATARTGFFGTSKVLEYAPDSPDPILAFGLPDPSHSFEGLFGAKGLAVNGVNHDVYVATYAGVVVFSRQAPVTVPTVVTGAAIPTPTTATLRGSVDPDGIDTTKCHFEWGTSTEYGTTVPCEQGDVIGGTDPVEVTAKIEGLSKGATYHFRLSAQNANGFVESGEDEALVGQDLPTVDEEYVTDVKTDSALVHATIKPEAGATETYVEFGTSSSYGSTSPNPHQMLVSTTSDARATLALSELQAGTEYHYRVVAINAAGETISAEDHTFKTFPFVPFLDDRCPNSLARQQTGAALLSDCRAYELVSAANSGGYNIESDLIPGQHPFSGYPLAEDRVLYGVHDGGIPGTGNPTNHGVDPYIATRTSTGWTTRYVGIPSNGSPSVAPFSSALLGASHDLSTLAFGGPDSCSPCFSDGSSGVPVRLPDGSLLQGMAGGAKPSGPLSSEGLITKALSEDGEHLLFGSVEQFAQGGNDGTGDISIYDRNLLTGVTQVVSTTPLGENLPCLQPAGTCHAPGNNAGIAALDMSTDGSVVVVAQRVSTDTAGNHYWHPYLHVGSSAESVDLAPGTTQGVLFDGMTDDGSRSFFTTEDKLTAGDSDGSADIYEARVDGAGPAVLRLVSTDAAGVPSNSDGCAPVSNWNTVSGAPNCDAVAFAGGVGLARGDGTFYFVSPELLDGGQGSANQANLYVVRPNEAPDYVATMDSSADKPGPAPPSHPIVNAGLITALGNPEALEVNQITGDIYVKERSTSTVARFTQGGLPHKFTDGPGAGTNRISGQNLGGTSEGQIAVDSKVGSLFENAFYVTSNSNNVAIFAESGEKLGALTGFGEACGVSVDQATGDVYVGDYGSGMWRFHPVSNATPVSTANYEKSKLTMNEPYVCMVTADTSGHVYASRFSSGPLRQFDVSSFGGPSVAGNLVTTESNAMNVDPGTDDVYVNAGGRIDVFESDGTLKEQLAKGSIAGSRGVAVNATTHRVYTVNGNSIIEIGYVVNPYEPIDNPAIVHGVRQAGVHTDGDFQVSADGHFAVFPSAVRITSFDSTNHLEIYRYDAESAELSCPSCTPTNARATGDASLARNGLSLTSDGRVFFTSTEPLVLRDTDSKKDAYQWDETSNAPQLISSGMSQFDSGLLSATADGRDVYFFTRDVLAPEDHNGTLMKIYDARSEGGYFKIAEAPPCAASDECHGPGTVPAVLPNNASKTGTPGNAAKSPRSRCKKGQVRKGRKCVKRRHHRNSKRRPGGAVGNR